MSRQKSFKMFQKKPSRQNLLFDIQKNLNLISKTLELLSSTMSISKNQKELISKKSIFDEMFRLLSNDLKCRIQSNVISKCVLLFFSLISDVFIRRMNEIYCGVFSDNFCSIKISKRRIRRADNFVRLKIFQKDKFILMNKHKHYCDFFQILFTAKYKTTTNRAIKLNKHIEKEIYNLKRYHTFFLQSLKKWTIKKIVWKYSIVLNWYTNNFENYIWSFTTNEIYDFFLNEDSLFRKNKLILNNHCHSSTNCSGRQIDFFRRNVV